MLYPFFLQIKKKFDLILVKQTIHLLKFNQIKSLLNKMSKNLKPNGKILILTLNPNENEMPNFNIMRVKLLKSLKRDKKIIKFISKLYPERTIKHFSYKVEISKKKYLTMISDRFISTLLSLNDKQIVTGMKQIDLKYKKRLRFNDKLVCIIVKNN